MIAPPHVKRAWCKPKLKLNTTHPLSSPLPLLPSSPSPQPSLSIIEQGTFPLDEYAPANAQSFCAVENHPHCINRSQVCIFLFFIAISIPLLLQTWCSTPRATRMLMLVHPVLMTSCYLAIPRFGSIHWKVITPLCSQPLKLQEVFETPHQVVVLRSLAT